MMKPKIVQGRTYRLSQRQQADATPEPAAQKPRQAAPCGDLVPDVPTHQNGCRACLSKAGAYLPPAVRELITDSMWSATGAQRMAAIAAWKRQEGDRLLAMLDRAAPSGASPQHAPVRACPVCGQFVAYSVQRTQRFFQDHNDPATGRPCQWWTAGAGGRHAIKRRS
jgi:hypothetical protein